MTEVDVAAAAVGGEPPFSTAFALGLSALYTTLFVAPFYLHPTTRPSPTISRDAPAVIRTRITLVSLSTLACTLLTLLLLAAYGLGIRPALRLMGYWPLDVSALKPVMLVVVLYAGPLFERGVVDGRAGRWVRGEGLREVLAEWTGWRNYVVGPLTEELFFRSLLLPLLLLTPLSPLFSSTSITTTTTTPSPLPLILLAPLPFGIAHLHHAYETHLTHPSTPKALIAASTILQFAYTTLFGWFAAFVLLRSGSVWTCVACHTLCNWLQLPRVWGRVGKSGWVWREEVDEDEAVARTVLLGGTEGERVSGRPSGRWVLDGEDRGVAWSVAYYVLLMAGMVGFWKGFWVLTECEGALVRF